MLQNQPRAVQVIIIGGLLLTLEHGFRWIAPSAMSMASKQGIKRDNFLRSAPIDVFRSIGVEAVATMVGLRWGGTFGGNYDPVHVDLELLPATKVAIIDAMGGTESVTTAIANISKVRLQTA